MTDPKRRQTLQSIGVAIVSAGLPWVSASAASWPARPITAVIGYKTGGGTDFVARGVSPLLEVELRAIIKTVNQPGATASIATDFVWNKPSDGHWWLLSSGFNRGLRVSGLHQTVPYTDWQFYMADTTVMSISVREDSPIKDFADFLDHCKKGTNRVRVSNSGFGGSWHLGGTLVKKMAAIDFVDVPYRGGKPAVLACLNGEVDAVNSGLHEQVNLIQSGQLRNLCVCSTKDINVKGLEVKTITRWVPSLRQHTPFGGGTTLGIKRDTDSGILRQVADAWVQAISSPEFKHLEAKKIRFPSPAIGAEADRKAALWETIAANLLHEVGKSKVDPKDLNIPPINEFDNFWPPKGYQPAI